MARRYRSEVNEQPASSVCACGERSAVCSNSGKTVHQSVPGLKRPTPSPTGGRKPSARPSRLQPKTGRGAEQRSASEIEREALETSSPSADREAVALSDFEITQILNLFRQLDRWDRKGSDASEVV
jgi:hypothetical protein